MSREWKNDRRPGRSADCRTLLHARRTVRLYELTMFPAQQDIKMFCLRRAILAHCLRATKGHAAYRVPFLMLVCLAGHWITNSDCSRSLTRNNFVGGYRDCTRSDSERAPKNNLDRESVSQSARFCSQTLLNLVAEPNNLASRNPRSPLQTLALRPSLL